MVMDSISFVCKCYRLMASTGLLLAARQLWPKTVATAMASAVSPASAKIVQLSGMRRTYCESQSCIRYQMTGTAMTKAANT